MEDKYEQWNMIVLNFNICDKKKTCIVNIQ